MNATLIVEDLIVSLERRYGKGRQLGKARVLAFGSSLICSVNYSKLLNGHKYFYAVPEEIVDPRKAYPKTECGEFVALICGSADKILFLPRPLMIQMLSGVQTRRVDVFIEDGAFILQTTKHPKLDVTDYLNAFPQAIRPATPETAAGQRDASKDDRIHVKIQWALISLGCAEGCSVWVPTNDRNLSYQRNPFSKRTLPRLPNFGFDETTRRIVQNIDVLWLTRNVIQRAFEIESTTSIYSGLLRLNDLVLAQPNIRIDLYLVSSKARHDKVRNQLARPSFQSLIPKVRSLTFESIEEQMIRLEKLPIEDGARVSGLIRGEPFELPDHLIYPSDV